MLLFHLNIEYCAETVMLKIWSPYQSLVLFREKLVREHLSDPQSEVSTQLVR